MNRQRKDKLSASKCISICTSPPRGIINRIFPADSCLSSCDQVGTCAGILVLPEGISQEGNGGREQHYVLLAVLNSSGINDQGILRASYANNF